MGKFVREKPIIVYSALQDKPDVPQEIKGVPDDTEIESVSVVVIRPSGDRYATIGASKEGLWYIAQFTLNITDELGEWTVRWVYKTNHGDVVDEHKIQIVSINTIPYWDFQSLMVDDSLPDDVRSMFGDREDV